MALNFGAGLTNYNNIPQRDHKLTRMDHCDVEGNVEDERTATKMIDKTVGRRC